MISAIVIIVFVVIVLKLIPKLDAFEDELKKKDLDKFI